MTAQTASRVDFGERDTGNGGAFSAARQAVLPVALLEADGQLIVRQNEERQGVLEAVAGARQ